MLISESLEPRMLLASWTPLTNLAPAGVATMNLMSDGTILAQQSGVNKNWFKLIPDNNGSYVNGGWVTLAPMSLERLYTGQNVMQDGRVLVLGGEYSGPTGTANRINTGEIYNPVTNTWTPIADFPQSNFGDGPTMLLDDGRIIAGYIFAPNCYLYNPANNTWTPTGSKLNADRSAEETWTKLPDNSVMSYNIFGAPQSSQRYVPATGTWVQAGTCPVQLHTSDGSELGPGLVIPDGRLVQIGGTSNNAIYNPTTNTWSALAVTPGGIGGNDAPAAMLPNGHILYCAGDTSTSFAPPTTVFDLDPIGNTITQVSMTNGPSLTFSRPYTTRMLVLPTGQVLFTSSTNQLYIYTGDGAPSASWRPTITNITGAGTYTLTGTKLNGMSSGASYGDDAEMDENYPIVRLQGTNGNVYFARSFNWNSTGIQANGATSVQFTLPAGIPNGNYQLTVIGAGISSAAVNFTVGGGPNGVWTGLGDGTSWTNAANWSNNTLPAPADDVIINVAGLQNILISAGSQTVHSLTCDENLSISGGSLSLGAASSINGSFTLSGGVLTGAGTFTLNNASNTWSGGSFAGIGKTSVAPSATFTISGVGTQQSIRPLEVLGTVNSAASGSRTTKLSTLSILGSGKFDLFNNDLIVTGTAKATIEAYVQSAYHFGDWLGTTGIFSTTAKDNPLANTTLGVMSGAEFNNNNGGTFNGNVVAAGNVLVKYTYFGDVDFNGSLDASDYNVIDFGFTNHLTGWANGDADYSGGVDASDYNVIDFAFATQSGVL